MTEQTPPQAEPAPAPLPASVQRVQKAAEELGIDIAIRLFAEPTRTAEEAAAALGCSVAQIVKSLVFRGMRSGKPYILLVSGKNRVNERALAGILGESVQRADAELVRKATGFAIGGVAPFGHAVKMITLMDRDLTEHDQVYAAAGTPNSIFAVAPNRLARVLNARVMAMD